MLTLAWRLNYRRINYTGKDPKTIGVRRKDGSYHFCPFLGYIYPQAAKRLNAVPVKIYIIEYSVDQLTQPWHKLKDEEHVQGAFVQGGVFALLQESDDMPRII